ncbi:MAG: cytochrome c maturation protein CcmE [Deltaproteobacteria bacterium]|nr:cytochrome c maturation protein CcmE [Deltaproteobacteria bacterium]MBW2416069.1 cytochrome c maturation protein CcmE [Deltaproteobacteria bacterium]
MSKGIQLGIATLTIFGALTWFLAVQAGGEGTFAYYENVGSFLDEAPADDAGPAGRGLRVHGFVVEGSIRKELALGHVDFEIQDPGGAPLTVRYDGIDVPDLFADGAEVVIEGRIESGVFLAERVMAKCPSKYEAEVPDESHT